MKKTTYILLLFSLAITLYGQNTVGLITYNQNKAFDGYNLIYPHNQPNVYLLDNCGEVVHMWSDDDNWRPGNTAYITENGYLYKAKRDMTVAGDAIWAGGGGAIFEIRDWDNNLVWSFEMNNEINRLHHDFTVKPNGNIIALAWELKTTQDCVDAGRDTSTLAQKIMWPEWIFEIDPTTDNIIWEWHTWNHLVQDFDAKKANFAILADNPQLVDVNFGRDDGHPDWMHSNALDYNADLGQIMMSVPYFNELWIIDQTTTTEQAADHFGGMGNVGGDLMYRWGNPITYDLGDSMDQKLFFQHDTHWIDDFLDASHPMYGKIGVFNNRVGEDFSTANIITPPWDMYEWKYLAGANASLPDDFDETITHPIPSKMFSSGLSSIQVLPNGNRLLTDGRHGYSFELTPDDEIVWEYITPRKGMEVATQGDILEVNNNLTFRMKRYPTDFVAFDGKDLTSKGWIELEPNEAYCSDITPTKDVMIEEMFKIYPNPSSSTITIEWDGMKYADISLINSIGQEITKLSASGGRKYLDVSSLLTGFYYVVVNADGHSYSRKIYVQ